MGWATRPKYPATLKSALDFQICRVDAVQHKSFTGMTGLMLREAFPSASLEDTKHTTESNQHWASNTNQIWETGISTQPCGEPQRHHTTWVKLAPVWYKTLQLCAVLTVAPFCIFSTKSLCPLLCLESTVVVKCSFCICCKFSSKDKAAFYTLKHIPKVKSVHIPFFFLINPEKKNKSYTAICIILITDKRAEKSSWDFFGSLFYRALKQKLNLLHTSSMWLQWDYVSD